MKKLYSITTSDKGTTRTVRTGHTYLEHKVSAMVRGGMVRVTIRLETQSNGDVVLTVVQGGPVKGFTVRTSAPRQPAATIPQGKVPQVPTVNEEETRRYFQKKGFSVPQSIILPTD